MELYSRASTTITPTLLNPHSLEGRCDAMANGHLNFQGNFNYDTTQGKIDARNLTVDYSAGAKFVASIRAGVQAKAFYFFSKNVYTVTLGAWTLGAAEMKGNMTLDDHGNLKVGKPEFSGVLAGEIDTKTGPKGEIIAVAKAKEYLRNAAISIPGSGEERKAIINEVKLEYQKAFEAIEKVIDLENDKQKKYLEKLARLEVKLNRYEKLLKQSGSAKSEEEAADASTPGKIPQASAKYENQQSRKKKVLAALKDKVTTARFKLSEKGKKKLFKVLIKFGIEDEEGLQERILKLDGLQKKYEAKIGVHSEKLKHAEQSRNEAAKVLKDVEGSMESLQAEALETGAGLQKVAVMETKQAALVKVQEMLTEQLLNLEEFETEFSNIETNDSMIQKEISLLDQVIAEIDKD